MIPLLGQILASDRASYQYLIESIERFPSQPEFAQMCVPTHVTPSDGISTGADDWPPPHTRIREAGFQTGEMREGEGGAWTDYTGGITSVHKGFKI